MSYQLCLNQIIEQYRNENPPIKIPRNTFMSETTTLSYGSPTEDCLCLIVRKRKLGERISHKLQLAYFKKEYSEKGTFATVINHQQKAVDTRIDHVSVIPSEEILLWASVSKCKEVTVDNSNYSMFDYDVCNLEAIINALLVEKYDGKTLAQCDEHIKRLTGEVERLNKAVSSISKEKQELFLKNEELTAESNELQEIYERYRSEKCEAESKQKALEISVKQLQAVIEHGEATANDLAEHNNTLTLQVAELTKQNAELQNRLDSSQKNPGGTTYAIHNNFQVTVRSKQEALEAISSILKENLMIPHPPGE